MAVAHEVNRGHGQTCSVLCRNRRAVTFKRTPLTTLFWERVVRAEGDECWGWTGIIDQDGYGKVKAKKEDGRPFLWLAHRLSWHINVGPIPEGMQVLHRCDNPRCSNPEHLFLGTNRDNMADRDAKGRQAKGMRCSLAKLTNEVVVAIRDEYASGEITCAALARKNGMSQNAIRNILEGRTWKHLLPDD